LSEIPPLKVVSLVPVLWIAPLFETPINGPLPEDLAFIP